MGMKKVEVDFIPLEPRVYSDVIGALMRISLLHVGFSQGQI